MAKIDIPFLVRKPAAHDRWRHYWQPSAFLKARGWTALNLGYDLDAAIKAAQLRNREVDAWKAAGGTEAPGTKRKVQRIVARGTVGALIRTFREVRFPDLAKATRVTYGTALTIIDGWAGDAPMASITRKRVQLFYAGLVKGGGAARAASTMRVLRTLFQFACDNDLLADNPATRARVTTPPPRQQLWSDAAIDAAVAAAKAEGVPSVGDAIMLAAYLGQRQGDILRLQWSQWKDGRIRLRQGKTGVPVAVKALPELAARLDQLQAVNLARDVPSTRILLRESDGQPYASTYFQRAFLAVKEAAVTVARAAGDDTLAAELAALQYRDLRRTAVVRLAEADVDLPGIAAISGHQIETTKRILETYLPRTTKMADAAIDKLADYRAKARGQGDDAKELTA